MTVNGWLAMTLSMLAFLCLWGGSCPGLFRGQVARDRKKTSGTRFLAGIPNSYGSFAAEGSAGGVTSVPLLLDFLGTALDAGLTLPSVLRVVAAVAEQDMRESLLRVVAGMEIGASWQDSWDGNFIRSDVAQIHEALSFGALTGASAAPLLYAEAKQCRVAAARSAEKCAAALGVKLVLPLGLCSLPAFIALGVVPVVMAMIPTF